MMAAPAPNPASSPVKSPIDAPVAILAGGGMLPIEIAAAVEAAGRGVHVVAIDGHADPALTRWPITHVRIGEVGRMLSAFAAAGCRDLVIAGSLERPDLRRLRLDLGAIRRLPVVFSLLGGGDDSLLRKIVRFFEREGLRVVGVGDVAPALLAREGAIGSLQVSLTGEAAIARAGVLIDALSPFDVGQAVVATVDGIVAIEGADGTDAMLRRLAASRAASGGGGGVLVKLAKRGQELRVDLPAIGPQTVRLAASAGLSGIAVEAGSAVVLQRSDLSRLADEAGLFVAGVSRSATEPAAARAASEAIIAPIGRRLPGPNERLDARLAIDAVEASLAHGGGPASVVLSRHVLAVAAPGERATAVIERAGRKKPWGGRMFSRRAGMLAIDRSMDPTPFAELADAVRRSAFAGIVMTGEPEAAVRDVAARVEGLVLLQRERAT